MLMEMIDHQLILADATDKEIKISSGEVREEMEFRFGPNIMLTLDNIGLTYDDTWKMSWNSLELVMRNQSLSWRSFSDCKSAELWLLSDRCMLHRNYQEKPLTLIT